MSKGIYAGHVISYPGIFDALNSDDWDVTLPDGDNVGCRPVDIRELGETSPTDYPVGFQPVHSWIIAWAVRVQVTEWLGNVEDWTKLVLRVFERPNNPAGDFFYEYILPLSDAVLSVHAVTASGETRIHGAIGEVRIYNDTGQTQRFNWSVYARAA